MPRTGRVGRLTLVGFLAALRKRLVSPEPPATMYALVIPLMLPTFMSIMAVSMFNVAIPTIRDAFLLDADTASWLAVAYSLPYMAAMPLYGRLGDVLGRRRMLLLGIALFVAGSALILAVPTVGTVFAGRVIQGLGTASVSPLTMAIIMELTQREERGKALGTWNSVGPVSGIAGPLIAGFVVDAFGWHSILWPIVGAGTAALLVAVLTVPISPRERGIDGPQRREIVRRFDWMGVVLFSLAACAVVVYASSRPITGRAPFTDFRLLAAFLAASTLFVLRERRVRDPYVRLGIFRNRNFSVASVCVGVRMSLMGGVNVLVPIMVRDLFDFSASRIGLLLVLHSVTLLSTMRLGGVLADRYRSRIPVSVGLTIQAAAMALLMLSPGENDVIWPYVALAIHGFGAGLSLATLHLFALTTVGTDAAATASGLYSMIRFAGSTIGTAIGGVLMQSGIGRYGIMQAAYTPLFIFYSVLGLLAAGLAVLLSASIPDR